MNPASMPYARLGLSRSPFPPTPDAELYFHTSELERHMAEASHCLLARKGFVLLTGEIGTGKSTFSRKLLDSLRASGKVRISLVLNTFLQGDELLSAVLRDFGLEVGADAAANIESLNTFLINSWRAGQTCILVIDDAQNLSLQSLELLRLLSSLETDQEKLLQILLCGQPELHDTLGKPELRQLSSRISEHICLSALNRRDTAHYAAFRLTMSGAAGRISLSAAGARRLYSHSHGVPRRIHTIMDRCLYGVAAQHHSTISAKLVDSAAQESGIKPHHRPVRLGPWLLAGGAFSLIALGIFGLYGAPKLALEAPSPLVLTSPPAAAEPSTTLQISTPAPTATSPALPANDTCAQALLSQPDTSPAGTLQLEWNLPASLRAHVTHLSHVCQIQRGDQIGLLWQPRLDSAQFTLGGAQHAVREVQRKLNAWSLYDAEIDGIYGSRTRQALSQFQQAMTLPPTGAPDALTLLLLDGATPPPAAPAHVPETAPSMTLTIEDAPNDVL